MPKTLPVAVPSPVPPAPAPRAPPPYALARSARAKRVTLRAVHGRGLVVMVPARLSRAAAETAAAAAVERHRDWAIGALAALRESVPEALRVWPPRSLELPALGRRVVLGFEPDGNGRRGRARVLASSVGAETVLALPCAPQAREAGVRALRAWLAREARTALGARLETLARRHGLGYARLAVRGQRTRWGSCSSSGTISLNWKLVFLPPGLVDYVLLHELAHTRHLDHSNAFWALLERLCPDARALDAELRGAGSRVPPWLEAGPSATPG